MNYFTSIPQAKRSQEKCRGMKNEKWRCFHEERYAVGHVITGIPDDEENKI